MMSPGSLPRPVQSLKSITWRKYPKLQRMVIVHIAMQEESEEDTESGESEDETSPQILSCPATRIPFGCPLGIQASTAAKEITARLNAKSN